MWDRRNAARFFWTWLIVATAMSATRGDLVNYAGVAGDADPLHWSEDIAKLAGQRV